MISNIAPDTTAIFSVQIELSKIYKIIIKHEAEIAVLEKSQEPHYRNPMRKPVFGIVWPMIFRLSLLITPSLFLYRWDFSTPTKH